MAGGIKLGHLLQAGIACGTMPGPLPCVLLACCIAEMTGCDRCMANVL